MTTTTPSTFHPQHSKHIGIAFLLLFALLALVAPDMAYAEGLGGLDKVNTFMDNIIAILSGASIAVVTLSVMWAGYKFLFTSANVMEVGKIVIAGLLIGGAAEIAKYMVG